MRAPRGIAVRALALASLAVLAVAQVNVSSPMAVKDQASSATGSAAPATASFTGGVSSGNLTGIVVCDSSAQISVSTATTSQMVALSAGKSIYVCAFVINGGGTTTAKLVYGAGTNCGTGQVALTPAFSLAVATTVGAGNGLGYVMKTAAANALCVTNSAAVATNVLVAYTQF